MKALLCAVFLVAEPAGFADTVTSVNCNVYGVPTVTDSHSCSLYGPYGPDILENGDAFANANANLSLASNPGSFSSLSVHQDVSVDGAIVFGSPVSVQPASAGSQVSVNETLLTAGSVRSGFVQISASGSGSFDARSPDSASIGLSFGPIQFVCLQQGGREVSLNCQLYPDPRLRPPPLQSPAQVEFTLGQAFQLSYSGTVGAGSGTHPGLDSSAGADANVQFQFRFVEADGVTPVAVEGVPEPGTLALFGAALVLLAVSKKKLQDRGR
jgi:hypothetical protein